MFNGMPIFSNSYLETRDKVPARTHRKKRITKKWLKRYGYQYIGSHQVVIFNNNGRQEAWAHPAVVNALQEKFGPKQRRIRCM